MEITWQVAKLIKIVLGSVGIFDVFLKHLLFLVTCGAKIHDL